MWDEHVGDELFRLDSAIYQAVPDTPTPQLDEPMQPIIGPGESHGKIVAAAVRAFGRRSRMRTQD